MRGNVSGLAGRVEDAVARVVKGQTDAVRLTVIAMLVQGHVLLEGNPGTAKTLLVRTLARLLDLEFRRIQFTPDLMPSDITGTSIFRPDRADFEFRKGPVFTQLLLADEINRAPARTQAALLQAMQERIVSADGSDFALSDMFTVIATQNPLESEGTYPLPEAELDRFLFKLVIDYPDEQAERDVFLQHGAPTTLASPEAMIQGALFNEADFRAAREFITTVVVEPSIADYTLALVRQTREHPFLLAGASTRAGVMLLRASRALAAISGRDFVIPDDVRELAKPALRHRMFRTAAAELEGLSTDKILDDILAKVPVPK
ncbi:MAG: MoxR family ATPase [Planctomycetaceae bacterium]|nr:MoxR family ATPase [Planctomycetaceae bacterium]